MATDLTKYTDCSQQFQVQLFSYQPIPKSTVKSDLIRVWLVI